MKRTDYSSDYMKARVKQLKSEGVDFFFCETSYTTTSGKFKRLKTAMKSTAQGISAYANKMLSKYGETVTVNVIYYDNKFDRHTLITYGA